jgi:hypothetical protein
MKLRKTINICIEEGGHFEAGTRLYYSVSVTPNSHNNPSIYTT